MSEIARLTFDTFVIPFTLLLQAREKMGSVWMAGEPGAGGGRFGQLSLTVN